MRLLRSAVLAALCALAVAEGNLEARDQLATQCYTSYVSRSHSHIQTYSSTILSTYTSTFTEYPTATIYPSPTTVTSTSVYTRVKKVTDSTETDTATSYSTTTSTETSAAPVSYYTSKVHSVETTTVSTITISAAPNFLPIQSTLPDSAYKRKRDALAGSLHAKKAYMPPVYGYGGKYPKNVYCNVIDYATSISTYTYTQSTYTSTVGSVSTSTELVPTTTTVYSTVYPPHVSTTITLASTVYTTSTLYPTSTTTITKYRTSTVIASPLATFYAQCADSNMASTGNGGALYAVDGTDSNYHAPASNRYDCCVACLLNPKCAWAYFQIPPSSKTKRTGDDYHCAVFEEPICTNPSQWQANIAVNSFSPVGVTEYFNGNCGQISGYHQE